MREKTKEMFMNILDTMSGADGGTRLVMFRGLLEEMDRRAASGDQSAERIILLVEQFSRLLDVAQIQK
jgi:hypothetical protein